MMTVTVRPAAVCWLRTGAEIRSFVPSSQVLLRSSLESRRGWVLTNSAVKGETVYPSFRVFVFHLFAGLRRCPWYHSSDMK